MIPIQIKRTSGFLQNGVADLVGQGYFNEYETPCLVIPDGVDRNETEEQNEKDEEEGSGPDVAYGLPNKDEGTKATLRKPKKY